MELSVQHSNLKLKVPRPAQHTVDPPANSGFKYSQSFSQLKTPFLATVFSNGGKSTLARVLFQLLSQTGAST